MPRCPPFAVFTVFAVFTIGCGEDTVGPCRADEWVQPWHRPDPLGASLPTLLERMRPILAKGVEVVWDHPDNQSCWRALGQPSMLSMEVTAEPQDAALLVTGCGTAYYLVHVERARFVLASADGLITHGEGAAELTFSSVGGRLEYMGAKGCTDGLEISPILRAELTARGLEERICFSAAIDVDAQGRTQGPRMVLQAGHPRRYAQSPEGCAPCNLMGVSRREPGAEPACSADCCLPLPGDLGVGDIGLRTGIEKNIEPASAP